MNNKELPDQFDVTIRPEDFGDAVEFCHETRCPLVLAVSGLFPGSVVVCSFTHIRINEKMYHIPTGNWGLTGEMNPPKINDLIAKAKDGLQYHDIPSVTLTLIKVR